jgi:molybdate transport system permease protein
LKIHKFLRYDLTHYLSSMALLLSLEIATLATLISTVIGVGFAALLTHKDGYAWGLIDGIINLPLVLPPTVLGYYLLTSLGARSPIGTWFNEHNIHLVFTWRGAVIAASVVALPLVVQSSRAAFETVSEDLIDVAHTLGRSSLGIFFTVRLPISWRGVLAGVALAYARALGEFGATMMVAGNIPGKTQTLPIAIYDAVQSGDQLEANLLSALLTIVAIIILFIIRRLTTQLVNR